MILLKILINTVVKIEMNHAFLDKFYFFLQIDH